MTSTSPHEWGVVEPCRKNFERETRLPGHVFSSWTSGTAQRNAKRKRLQATGFRLREETSGSESREPGGRSLEPNPDARSATAASAIAAMIGAKPTWVC